MYILFKNVQTINVYNVVEGSNMLPAWHKSNIWDAATTAGVAQGQDLDLAHIRQSCIYIRM